MRFGVLMAVTMMNIHWNSLEGGYKYAGDNRIHHQGKRTNKEAVRSSTKSIRKQHILPQNP
jgi:hypothetical protein